MAVLASETASTTGGREGKSTSPDGKINLNISPPGSNGPGTNPEQLFAATGHLPDTIDEFYAELKAGVAAGQVEEVRSGTEGVLLRVKHP